MATTTTTATANTSGGRADVYNEIQQAFGQVPSWVKEIPEPALAGFWAQMRDLQLGETLIPNKYKELIGLAVSGATRCRYCALFHTEAARLFGASDGEIAEAAAMAGFTMEASTFLNAMQVDQAQFRKETLEIVAYVKQQMAQTSMQGAPKATHTQGSPGDNAVQH